MKYAKVSDLMFTENNIVEKRDGMVAALRANYEMEQEYFDEQLNLVDITYEKVTVSDGAKIELVVYKPKSLETTSIAPAYIYAHGGGAFAFEARDFNNIMAVTCQNLNCVVISVDFRKGPEVKCPRG